MPKQLRSPRASVRYSFRHALFQDAIYESLLKRTRKEYHRRIAEMLQVHFSQVAQAQPKLIAQHYHEAGMQAQAADLWLQAGQQATTQGATQEARTFFNRVLETIDSTDIERRWAALVGREYVFDLMVDRDAQKKDIDTLLQLAKNYDDTRQAQTLLLEIDYAIKRRENSQLALPVVDEAITLAHGIGNIAFEVRALAGKLQILFDSGYQAAAHKTVDEILTKLPDVKEDATQAYALGKVSIFYLSLGYFSRAVQLMNQGAQAARQAGDPYLEIRFMYNMGFAYIQMGLYEQALTIIEEVKRLAESRGDQQLISRTNNLPYVHWCLGKRDQAIQLGEQTLLTLGMSAENPYHKATCLAYLGYFLEFAGQ
jgi:tetratricopeptide (TPR) repeat protein